MLKVKELRKKNKSTEKKLASEAKGKGIIVFGLLCTLLFYPPFFRGLFFQKEILITHVISFGLFVIYLFDKIIKEERIDLDSPFDFIGLVLIVAYILPIVFWQWVDLRKAIGLVLRYINFFVIYIMVKDYVKERKYKTPIIYTFILSGVTVAIIGILGVTGYVNLQDVVLGNRMASTFQYPNTLAAFMMTMIFLAMGSAIQSKNLGQKNLLAIGSFVMFTAFILTYSRGAWLLFPILALVYIAVIPMKTKIEGILFLIVVSMSNLLLMQPLTKFIAVEEEKKLKALLLYITATIVFILLYNVVEFFRNKMSEKHFKYIYIAIGLVTGITIIFAVVSLSATKPLTFDNAGISENRINQIQRPVRNVGANQQYNLNLELEANTPSEEVWAWRVQIFSISEEKQRKLITEKVGTSQERETIDLLFTTLDDTEHLIVQLSNVHPDTKVTFYEARLFNEEQMITKIKLDYKYLPEELVSRFQMMEINDRNASVRMAFYGDSMRIFKDYPVFGAGGGAWQALYPNYQTIEYNSTEAHNYYLQTLIETGIIGILALGTLLLTLVLLLVKSVRDRNIQNTTIIIAILSLLSHSALDFNFSYLSIPILLWGLIALLEVESAGQFKLTRVKEIKIPSLVAIIVILPILFYSGLLFNGTQLAVQGAYAAQQGDLETALDAFDKAASRDSFNSEIHMDNASLSLAIARHTEENYWVDKAEYHLMRGLKFSPYNSNALMSAVQFYTTTGEFDNAIKYIDELIEKAPLKVFSYETGINAYIAIGNHYKEIGEDEKAIEAYQEALSLRERAPVGLNKATLDMVENIIENLQQ